MNQQTHTAPKPPAKRRGRPRSPVFSYFRRIVDEKGLFIGNECRFCTFVSRDRSENPTYLTRHILRTCSAPQNVKDTMAVRHPAIAVSSYNPSPTRFVPPKSFTDSPCLSAAPPPEIAANPPVLNTRRPSAMQPITSPFPPPPPFIPAAPMPPNSIPQNLVRAAGVTKARRGRPRSPALIHFRRHIDEKGVFIANQCVHCNFVSRDRSENSTLLLRHLLSRTCQAPEDVCRALRARTTTDPTSGRPRTKRSPIPNNNAVQNLVDPKATASTPTQQPVNQLNRDPDHTNLTLLRFFLTHRIDLNVVDTPLFKQVADCILPSAGRSEDQPSGQHDSHSAPQPSAKGSDFLPSKQSLHAVLKQATLDQLLARDVKPQQSSQSFPSKQLFIYFPRAAESPKYPSLAASLGVLDEPLVYNVDFASTFIASAFSISDTGVSYLSSKNCQHDFPAGLASLVDEAIKESQEKFEHIVISRPHGDFDKVRSIPRNDPDYIWNPDIAREVDILCQELLAQVPLLFRCTRRNKLLASFFREGHSEGTAARLFGRSAAEKEQCQRYLTYVCQAPRYPLCSDILEGAIQTYDILCHAQKSHEDQNRLRETGSFLQALAEENALNLNLCQEVIRLVLSAPYRKELKVFISVLTPLCHLIDRYSIGPNRPADRSVDSEFVNTNIQSRSIAHVLPDCVRALRELYVEKVPELENDLLVLRGHTATRLLGKGTDAFPAIADDVSYVAAFLNPGADLSTTKGLSVEEAWRRAVSFLHSRYGSRQDVVLDRILEQLQSFHRRSGVFAAHDIFSDEEVEQDPRLWWEKHGGLAPELCAVATRVLAVPTTMYPVMRVIGEENAKASDLRGTRGELEEKQRRAVWNLKLEEARRVTEVATALQE